MADDVANPDADGLVGAITAYAGETLPGPKYRFCHGTQTVSRTDYSLLFSRLGESWGAGDGSTTFNLPNLDGRFLTGYSSTLTDQDAVGETGGSTASSLPAHTHSISPNPHDHANGASSFVANPGAGAGILVNGGASLTGSTSLTVGSTGSGTGENRPPYATVRYIIKVL